MLFDGDSDDAEISALTEQEMEARRVSWKRRIQVLQKRLDKQEAFKKEEQEYMRKVASLTSQLKESRNQSSS